jgi:O-antigen/teichoic acid export membrane protein
MITKRFVKSSIIYSIAGALPMASAVILLPFYQNQLTIDQFGVLSLYLAFAILIQIITTASFDASLYLHFHDFKNDLRGLHRFVSSAFITVLLVSVVVTVVTMVIGPWVFASWLPEDASFFPYGIMAMATGIFQSVVKVNNSRLQSEQRPMDYLWVNCSNFGFTVLFTVLGLYFYPSTLLGPVGGRMLAFLFTGGWILTNVFRQFGVIWDRTLLHTTLRYNTYQFLYQLQQWIIGYADRFIMVIMVATADLGVYDFTIKCLLVLDFVIAAVYNSFFPKVLSLASDQERKGTTPEINRYFHGLTSIVLILISLSIVTLPELLALTKPEYAVSAYFIPWLALIYVMRPIRYFFSLPYNILKESKPLPIIFLLVSIAKLGLSVLLIKDYSIFGALTATLVGSLLEAVLMGMWMRNRFLFIFNWKKILLAPAVFMIMVLVFEPLAQPFAFWMHVIYFMITILLLAWLYRKEVPLVLAPLGKIFKQV